MTEALFLVIAATKASVRPSFSQLAVNAHAVNALQQLLLEITVGEDPQSGNLAVAVRNALDQF